MTNGASHLPADESGMISINLLTMIAMGSTPLLLGMLRFVAMQSAVLTQEVLLLRAPRRVWLLVRRHCIPPHAEERTGVSRRDLRAAHNVFCSAVSTCAVRCPVTCLTCAATFGAGMPHAMSWGVCCVLRCAVL